MNGQELYAKYTEVNLERGTEVEAWDDLNEENEGVWNSLAEVWEDELNEAIANF